MLARIIGFSIRQRWFVLAVVALAAALSDADYLSHACVPDTFHPDAVWHAAWTPVYADRHAGFPDRERDRASAVG